MNARIKNMNEVEVESRKEFSLLALGKIIVEECWNFIQGSWS
jgi:hypothetical protein